MVKVPPGAGSKPVVQVPTQHRGSTRHVDAEGTRASRVPSGAKSLQLGWKRPVGSNAGLIVIVSATPASAANVNVSASPAKLICPAIVWANSIGRVPRLQTGAGGPFAPPLNVPDAGPRLTL